LLRADSARRSQTRQVPQRSGRFEPIDQSYACGRSNDGESHHVTTLYGKASGEFVLIAGKLCRDLMLQAIGDTTLTATDGREGVALAERESPHVILMRAD
jgi:hypothetical protein